MKKKLLQKQTYISPKIEMLLIEMESCFGFWPSNSFASDKIGIRNFLEESIELIDNGEDKPLVS